MALNYRELNREATARPTRRSASNRTVASVFGESQIATGPTIVEAVTDFANYHKNKGSAPRTIAEMLYLLDDRQPTKATWLPLQAWCNERGLKHLTDLNGERCQAWLDQMRDNGGKSTGPRAVVGLKRLLAYCKESDLLDKLPIKLREPRRVDSEIAVFTDDEMQRIVNAVRKENVRDWAILMLLLDTGIRANELVIIELEDLRLDRRELLVHGKGNGGQGKIRVVPLKASVGPLKAYLRERGDIPKTPWLFVPFAMGHSPVYSGGSGKTDRRQRDVNLRSLLTAEAAMTTTGLRALCTKWGKLAMVTEARNSPHTYRHYFAVTYLRNGGDVFTLQKILGHAKLEMTMRYAKMAQIDVQRVHSEVSPAMKFLPARSIRAVE